MARITAGDRKAHCESLSETCEFWQKRFVRLYVIVTEAAAALALKHEYLKLDG